MPAEPEVLFRHPSRKIRRGPLRDFWRDLIRRLAGGPKKAAASCGAVCLITTDRELRTLNRRFRGKNYATDVLSFAPETGAAKECRGVPCASGEVAISFDRALSQASEHGHSVEEELRILMLHGMLHLAGMDHEADSGEMARAEARWRRKFDLPASLTERARRPA